jgi:hypothetical protein
MQTAEEVAQWLEAYLAHLQRPTSQARPRLPVSNRNRKRLLSIGLVGLAIMIGGVGWSYFGQERELPGNRVDIASSNDATPSANSETAAAGERVTASFGPVLKQASEALAAEEQAWGLTELESQRLSKAIELYQSQAPRFHFSDLESDSLAEKIRELRGQLDAFERSQFQW